MKMLRSMTATLAQLAFATLPVASASSQLRIEACTAGLGQPTAYEIRGGRTGFPFLLLTSFQRSNFPMSAIDPRDTRTLGVGLDLLALLVTAPFDASGGSKFQLPIPNDTSLAGKALLHRVLSYPGTTTTFGEFSNVLVVPLDAAGSWREDITKTMFNPRAWTSLIDEGDGNYLVAGGGSGALLALVSVDTSDRFDLATRTFTQGPKMSVERGVHTVSRLPGKKYLLAGGVDRLNDPQATCDLYDVSTQVFTSGAPMSDKRMAHSATELADGRVFVAGGLNDMSTTQAALVSALASTEIYDPVTNKWTKGPDMGEGKAGHAALRLPDGRVLLSGGLSWRSIFTVRVPTFSSVVEIYDPKNNTISRVNSMASDRAGHAAVLLASGKVLVAGGIGGSILVGGVATAACELFDPASGQWSATGSLPTAKALGALVQLGDGSPAWIGGAAGSFLAPLPLDDCASYDVASAKWTSLPKLMTARATHVAAMSDSCAVFAIGGATGASNAAVTTAETLIR